MSSSCLLVTTLAFNFRHFPTIERERFSIRRLWQRLYLNSMWCKRICTFAHPHSDIFESSSWPFFHETFWSPIFIYFRKIENLFSLKLCIWEFINSIFNNHACEFWSNLLIIEEIVVFLLYSKTHALLSQTTNPFVVHNLQTLSFLVFLRFAHIQFQIRIRSQKKYLGKYGIHCLCYRNMLLLYCYSTSFIFLFSHDDKYCCIEIITIRFSNFRCDYLRLLRWWQ